MSYFFSLGFEVPNTVANGVLAVLGSGIQYYAPIWQPSSAPTVGHALVVVGRVSECVRIPIRCVNTSSGEMVSVLR